MCRYMYIVCIRRNITILFMSVKKEKEKGRERERERERGRERESERERARECSTLNTYIHSLQGSAHLLG